jgi:hypothetical protein
MEWMLQVVDELDDAIGAARHHWYGVNADLAMIFARLRGSLRIPK